MRRLLIILALLPTMLWGQTSPALNTLTGPYRGPMSWVTPKTLKDSIDVLEARLLAAISDSTGLAFDSVYALSAALIDIRNRYLADSTETARQLLARTDTIKARLEADSTRLDSLYTKICLDSLCLVNLNFSRATYANNIWTIPNDANKAAPAYMYGGLGWGVNGSDSSGVSRDSLTGRVVMALDGSAGDSAVTATGAITLSDGYTPNISYTVTPKSITIAEQIHVSLLQTSDSVSLVVGQRKDSLVVGCYSSNNIYASAKRASIFSLTKRVHISARVIGNKVFIEADRDSVLTVTIGGSGLLRHANKFRVGSYYSGSSARGPNTYTSIRLYSRALTSAERLTLYNNSLRGIQPPGPSMGDIEVTPRIFPLTAGEITRPGYFYKISADGKAYAADTSITVKAVGVALDTVAANATVRLQTAGPVTFARWINLTGNGKAVYSDSVTAGKASRGGQSNTKKMQAYGTMADSTTGKVLIDIDPNVWIWEN